MKEESLQKEMQFCSCPPVDGVSSLFCLGGGGLGTFPSLHTAFFYQHNSKPAQVEEKADKVRIKRGPLSR